MAKLNKIRRDLVKQLNPSAYMNFFAGCSSRRSEYEVRKQAGDHDQVLETKNYKLLYKRIVFL